MQLLRANMIRSSTLFVLGICALLPFPAIAQSTGPNTPTQFPEEASKDSSKAIRVDVPLVLVNLTVTDPLERVVTGLERENFRVFEDGKEQEVLTLSNEDAPISVGVIFDMSGSMADKIDKARQAAV